MAEIILGLLCIVVGFGTAGVALLVLLASSRGMPGGNVEFVTFTLIAIAGFVVGGFLLF